MESSLAEPISIIFADDHPLFRSGIRAELERIGNLNIIGEAENGAEALSLITEHQPTLAILDIRMPKLTGLDVAQEVSQSDSETKIILLTMHKERKLFLRALELGVKGYLLKEALISEIQRAVTVVAAGSYYLSPELSDMLIDQVKSGSKIDPDWKKLLTPSEMGILELIADLKSNDEIAQALFISKRTVENHRVNISRKLAVSGTNSLLKFAVKNKSLL